MFFQPNQIVLALRPPKTRQRPHDPGRQAARGQRPTLLRLSFLGANRAPSISGADRLPGVANYLIGNNPNKWRTNIPTYAGVVYQQLYDGIDLRFDGSSGQLKSTYTIAPGADPYHLIWRYDGGTSTRVDAAGNLVVTLPTTSTTTTAPTLTELAPEAWQIVNGRKVTVAVEYVVADDGSIGFALGAYDRTRPLIVDPALIYNTPIGGSQYDQGNGIAVDNAGYAYIVGTRYSDNVEGTLINADAFVAGLNQDGSGADSVVGTVNLESSAPLKGGYSAAIPTIGNSQLREDFSGADELYVSFYLRVDALPSSTTRIAVISNSGTTVGELQLTTAGKLRLRHAGTTIGSDSAALSVGSVYRVGLHQKRGTGANALLEAYVASGTAAFTTPFANSSSLSFTTPATRLNIGATTSSAPAAITVDDIVLDTGSMPAP